MLADVEARVQYHGEWMRKVDMRSWEIAIEMTKAKTLARAAPGTPVQRAVERVEPDGWAERMAAVEARMRQAWAWAAVAMFVAATALIIAAGAMSLVTS